MKQTLKKETRLFRVVIPPLVSDTVKVTLCCHGPGSIDAGPGEKE